MAEPSIIRLRAAATAVSPRHRLLRGRLLLLLHNQRFERGAGREQPGGRAQRRLAVLRVQCLERRAVHERPLQHRRRQHPATFMHRHHLLKTCSTYPLRLRHLPPRHLDQYHHEPVNVSNTRKLRHSGLWADADRKDDSKTGAPLPDRHWDEEALYAGEES